MLKEQKVPFTTLYMVRHGETEWNRKDILQGQLDSPLTPRGIEQARQLGEALGDVHFDAIFTSDLLRARRTAEIATLERELAVVTSELLRERNWGRYDGKRYNLFQREAKDLIEKFQQLSHEEQWRFKYYEDIESNEEVFGRFMAFLREIAIAYPGKTILVVTHLNVMETLLIHLGENPVHVDNLACLKILSDGVQITLEGTEGITLARERV